MKTSNKIVWGSLVGLLVVGIIFLIVLRALLVAPADAGNDPAGDAAMGSKEIVMSGFVDLDLQGNWQVELSQGATTKIRVEGPEHLLKTLSVHMRDESLVLHMAKQHRAKHKLTLTVIMPEMNQVQTKGVADVTITGFTMDLLSIHAEGVSTIRGLNSRIGSLILKTRGVSHMELEKIPVGHADLDCEGVFNVDLTMDGGRLTGSIKGVGQVRYGGHVGHESLRREGPCKVVRKTTDNRAKGGSNSSPKGTHFQTRAHSRYCCPGFDAPRLIRLMPYITA